ncbi:hypothetical protein QZH41_016475 [Actinostola sp. cb2023]|nr:hypothetical protein QZH41_016475 [Actinostola sp. cb2023]
MSYYGGGGGYRPPKVNYLPNIDSNLLATVRDEMVKKEEEKREQQRRKEAENRKVANYLTQLQAMVRELPGNLKSKLTFDVLNMIATSLLDGTVFEIVKGLEDIQQLTERNLLNRRMKLLNSHKAQRMEMNKRHTKDIEDCQQRPHNLPVVERDNLEENQKLETTIDNEMLQLDQKVVLELDQIVSDQQATLERAGVPLFFITNKSDDVRLQMNILDFIQRLMPSS